MTPKTLDTLRADLKALGKTKAEVAATLKRKRCKGAKENGASCPVSLYLKRLGYKRFHVSKYEAMLFEPGDSVRLPRAVAAFIRGFDAGEFPELQSK